MGVTVLTVIGPTPDRYEGSAHCSNCGWTGIVTPLKGLRVWTEMCPNCEVPGTLSPCAIAERQGKPWV